MRAKRYSYSPRQRPTPAGGHLLWLVFPVLLVVSVVALAPRLPDYGGSLLAVASTTSAPEPARATCAGDGGCTAVVSLVPECAQGGDCAVAAAVEPSRPIGNAPPPETTAPYTAVLEEPCGELVYAVDQHEPRPPASITKIATALVVVQHAGLAEYVPIDIDGGELALATDSTVMGVKRGQQLTVLDLLYGLLLPSGNDAALELAEYVAGSPEAFADLMNAYVESLGLYSTHFTNPHGLDDADHYTSAYDIAVLAHQLLANPELAAIVSTPVYQPAWDDGPVWNGNRLLQLYPGALGVKIGYTDQAGQTIVAAAERYGRRVIVSVLGSSDIYADSTALLDWTFDNTQSACPG